MIPRSIAIALAIVLVLPGCKRKKPEPMTRIWLGPTEACAELASREVVCWGAPDGEQPRRRPELDGAREVSLGTIRSGALFPDRRARFLGEGERMMTADRIAVGGDIACAADGKKLSCWGGIERTLETKAPANALAVGGGNVCAAVPGDAVYCFGARSADVARLLSGAKVFALAAGGAHTCALLEDGAGRCWGKNDRGQLGDGTTNDSAEPVVVEGLVSAVQIAAGDHHTCARLRNGTVACWGANASSELADGTTRPSARPKLVQGIVGAVEIGAARGGTCVRVSDGEVRCWGDNDAGQLSFRLPHAVINVPTPVAYVRR